VANAFPAAGAGGAPEEESRIGWDVVSYIALAVIVASIAWAWSKKFLSLGALAIGNLVVFAITAFAPDKPCRVGDAVGVANAIHCDLGLHTDKLVSLHPEGILQLLTSMFVHSGFLHLAGNLLILTLLALPFEERIGHRPFLAAYLVTGLAAALIHTLGNWGDPALLMGASGAVFGILGAFAGTFPRLVIPIPIPVFIIIFVRMQVWVAAAVFAVLQFLLQYLSSYNPGDNTAYLAHVGGLAAGLLWSFAILRRQVERGNTERKPIPVERFEPFARDDAARNALGHMQANSDVPDVYKAWQERFLKSARCPTCDHPVAPVPRGLLCTRGHRFDLRKGPATEG
jgi:membrane associated rhomboid family serine protease